MGYAGYLFQALALVAVALSFVAAFPDLMDFRVLLASVALFILGWMLRRKTA